MKNLTKKIFALVLAAIIGCTSFAAAMAEDATANVPDIKFDAPINTITVSGTIKEAVVANSTLIIYVYHTETVEGEEVTVDDHMDYTQTYKDENGKIAYAFPSIKLQDTFKSTVLNIEITGEDLDAPIEATYSYQSAADIFDALKKMSVANAKATEDKNYEALFDAFKENNKVLGFSVDRLDDIEKNSEAKKAYAAILLSDVDYGKPDEVANNLEAKIAYNTPVLEQLSGATSDAETAAKFVMINNSADVSSWYDEYYKALEFDQTDADKYVEDEKGSADFADRIANAKSPITINEIREYIYESAILATIADEEKTAAEIEKLVFEYDEDGEYFDDVKTTKYNGLAGDIKAKILDEFIHVSYEDCDAAVEALNDLISKDWSGDDDDDGGSKGGTRGTVSLPNSLVADNNQAADAEKGFTDLDGFEWAEEAISDLAERGIVNGKADGIYAPNDNVTRAEFIKMVVSAMGVELGGAENAFADVAQDAWYAPYVAAAYRNAIVLGDEKGNFYPEAPITREDMVTILYRAVDAEAGAGRVEKFSDAAQISDYAKDAVGYFASKNIVNGMGDGSFAPKNNATRAETAVIIYRIITTLK